MFRSYHLLFGLDEGVLRILYGTVPFDRVLAVFMTSDLDPVEFSWVVDSLERQHPGAGAIALALRTRKRLVPLTSFRSAAWLQGHLVSEAFIRLLRGKYPYVIGDTLVVARAICGGVVSATTVLFTVDVDPRPSQWQILPCEATQMVSLRVSNKVVGRVSPDSPFGSALAQQKIFVCRRVWN